MLKTLLPYFTTHFNVKNELPSTDISSCQQVLYITVKKCRPTLLCRIDLIQLDWSFKNEYVQYETTASQLDLMLHFDYATLKHVNLVFLFGAIQRQSYKSALDLCPDS